MPNAIGIMLGRLTPSGGRGIQFFPAGDKEWEKEFDVAAKIGLNHIEWVWDKPDNPLLDEVVRRGVKERITQTGVGVKGADLQFLTKTPIEEVPENTFFKLCEALADVGAGAIEPPLLEGSTLLNDKRAVREKHLRRLVEIAKKYGLAVNLETDLGPEEYKKLLESIPGLFVVYDSGNSAHFGYSISKEWDTYGAYIRNVQIKDRPLGGSTVPLGQGGVDFKTLLKKMKEVSYTGLVTFQAARGEDGKEVETIEKYRKFIKDTYESI
jgi:L-ribulose-5-phosphate 3-epimerase